MYFLLYIPRATLIMPFFSNLHSSFQLVYCPLTLPVPTLSIKAKILQTFSFTKNMPGFLFCFVVLNIKKVVVFRFVFLWRSGAKRRMQAESKSSLWLRLKVDMVQEREVLSGDGEVGEQATSPLAFILLQQSRAAQSSAALVLISSPLIFPWWVGLAKQFKLYSYLFLNILPSTISCFGKTNICKDCDLQYKKYFLYSFFFKLCILTLQT